MIFYSMNFLEKVSGIPNNTLKSTRKQFRVQPEDEGYCETVKQLHTAFLDPLQPLIH